MKNLLNNLLNWVLKKGSSETKKEQAWEEKEQAGSKKDQVKGTKLVQKRTKLSEKEQAGSKKEQAEQKGNKLSKKGTSLEMNPCVRGSEVREVMGSEAREVMGSEAMSVKGSEAVCANHALITQLSRNNHPISLRAIRYAAVLFMVLMVGVGNVWADTPITWTPTSSDVSTLTGTQGAHVDVGTSTNSYQIYAVRGGGSNKNSDSFVNGEGLKFGDGNLYKSGIAVYVPSTSNSISSIEFYIKTTNSRSTKYVAVDAIGLSSEPSTSSRTLTTSYVSYSPFSSPTKAKYYVVGGYSGGSGDVIVQKIIVNFSDGGDPTPSTYTVTYDGNGKTGGSVPTDSHSPYEENDEVTVLGNTGTLVKTNYTFTGWNTATDGSGTHYDAGDQFDMGTANVILYAEWELNLTTHTPGKYTTAAGSGGYGKTLKTVGGRDYEVYHISASSSKGILYAGSSSAITDGYALFTGKAANEDAFASDGWVVINANAWNNSGSTSTAEFNGTSGGISTYSAGMNNQHRVVLKISGYDQFTFIGRDKANTDGSKLVVKIDGVSQSFTHQTSDHYAYRFDITTGTHTIEITGDGTEESRFRGFSLRLPAAACTAPTAVYVTQTAGSSDMIAGESFTLSAATSTGVEEGATYQWYRNTTEVGTSSPTFTVPSCTKVDAGTYWCKITNPCSSDAHTTNTVGFGIKVWQVLLYESSTWNSYDLTSTGTKTGRMSRQLAPGTYYIKLTHNNGVDFGVNTGSTISEITATTPSPWTLYGSQNNIKLTVTTAGEYTFDVNYTSADYPTLSVTYPPSTISSCDKIYFCPTVNSIATGDAKFSIYFYNGNSETGWANCYLVDGTEFADGAKYVAYAPATTNGWTSMIVVRDDEYASSFSGIWNQSQDITYNGYNYIVGTGWSDGKFTNNLNSFYSSTTPAMSAASYATTVGETTNASTNLTGATITYASDDPSVATVNSSGVITGVAAGETTITASVGSCTVGSATITVSKNTPTAYTVSGTTTICSGSTATITLSGSEDGASYQLKKGGVAEGVAKAGTGSSLTWTVSAAGTYTVSAVETAKYLGGDMTDDAVITVNTPVTISWNNAPANGTVGGSMTASVTTNYSDGVAYSVQSATPAGCVTVGASTGVISYVAAGTATIRATVTGAGDYCSSAYVDQAITVTAAASLTAISADVLYQAASMANITFTGDDQNFTGLSTNNLFKVYGTDGNAAKGKNENHNVTDDISTKSFTSALYILSNSNTTSTDDPTQGAIEIITPSTAGLLYLYLDANNSSLTLKKKGTKTSTSLSGATYKAMEVDANTHYFINGSTSGKRGLYGIQYVSTYSVSITPTNVTKATGATGAGAAIKGKAYTATFTAPVGYTLPSDVTSLTIGGTPQTKGSGYTWTISAGTATLTVPAAKVTGNIVVSVAGVAASTYSITYDCDGAESGCPSNVAAAYTLPSPLPSAPTKDGYDFVGWYTNSTKTVVAVAGAALSENTILYAKWTVHSASECITITDFATSNTSCSNNIPDNNSKYFYGYKGTVDDAHAVTITSNDGNDRGQNSGVEMRLTYNKKMRIYANNTTNATPAGFENVVSVSFKWKFIASGNSGNTELTSSYTIKVGSTTIANAVSITGKTNDGYATVTIDNLAQLNGYIEFLFGGSSSSYNVYLDDIEICTADMAACTTPTLPTATLSNQTVCEGSDIAAWDATPTNASTISGKSESISYSWKKKGSETVLGTGATFDLGSSAAESQAGTYVVTVTVSKAGYTSASASKEVTLTVNEATEVTAITADKATVYPTNSVTLTATANITPDSWRWYTCTNAEGDGESSIGSATSASYTIASAGSAGTYYYKVKATGDCGTGSMVYTLTVSAAAGGDCFHYVSVLPDKDISPSSGASIVTPTHATTLEGGTMKVGSQQITITKNGLKLESSKSVSITLDAALEAGNVVIVKGTAATAGYGVTINGVNFYESGSKTFDVSYTVLADDGLVGKTALTVTKYSGSSYLQEIKITGCGSSCTDPEVTASADNTTACVGTSVTFTAANAHASATYQWQKLDGTWTNISDETASTYTIPSVVAGDAGKYRVIATHDCSRTSNEVTLSVPSAPDFGSTVPASVSVMQTIALSINTVEATDAVKYRWYKSADETWDAGDVEIGTNKELIKAYDSEAIGSPSYYIFCRAQNACDITTSTAIAVTVTAYVEEDCATRGNEGDAAFSFENSGAGQGSYESAACWTMNSNSKILVYYPPTGKYFKTAKVTIASSSENKASYNWSTNGGTDYTAVSLTVNSTLTERTINLSAHGNVNAFQIGRNFDSKGSSGGTLYVSKICFEYTDACTTTTVTPSTASTSYEMGGAWSNPTFTLTPAAVSGETLTYSSSNEDIASVDDDGTVTFNGEAGTVTITASYAGGTISATDYCASSGSYTITVSCTGGAPKVVASGTTVECSSSITLQAKKQDGTAFADGTYQWFRNGEEIDGATGSSYTATQAGTYTVARTNTSDCTTPSTNSAIVTSVTTEPEVERLVPFQYYHVDKTYSDQMKMRHLFAVKNSGKLDGKSFKMYVSRNGGEAADVTGSNALVVWPNGDGHVDTVMVDLNKLSGKYSEDDELVFTCKAIDCSGNVSEVYKNTITMNVIGETPTLALICSGSSKAGGTRKTGELTVGGDFLTGYNVADLCQQTGNTSFDANTEWGLYTDLKTQYIVTPVNGYAVFNKLNYEPFDILLLTDYPKASKSDAAATILDDMAALCDYRPMLSFKTHMVAKSPSKWAEKGFTTSPVVTKADGRLNLNIVCYAHPMFDGLKSGEDVYEDANNTSAPLVYTMLSGTGYESSKGMQGFELAAAENFVTIGLTHYNATITTDSPEEGEAEWAPGTEDRMLVTAAERQTNIEARFILFSINCGAQSKLTPKGEEVILACLDYLLKTDPLEVADCSFTFDNGASNEHDAAWYSENCNTCTGTKGDGKWTTAANWGPHYRLLPGEFTSVRIKKPVEVNDEHAHVMEVRLIDEGRIDIPAGKALDVKSTIRRMDGSEIYPTDVNDIHIGSASTGNGTLIFNNNSGDTKARVDMYSTALADVANMSAATSTWQYIGTPHNDVAIATYNYYDSWLYQYSGSGWEVIPNGGPLVPFRGYCVTHPAAPVVFDMVGTLVATTSQDIAIPAGYTVIANSWVAPIDINAITDDDMEGISDKSIYFFNTGSDVEGTAGTGTEAGTYRATPIHSASYTGDWQIPSMQGFYISTTSAGTLHLDYERHVRPADSRTIVSNPMYAPRRAAAESGEPAVLKIFARGSRYQDKLVVLEREDFTRGYDSGWDGEAWGGGTLSPMVYVTGEGREDAVSAIPEFEGTVVAFKAGEDSEYRLEFIYDGDESLYLFDTENNTYTQIMTGNAYYFTTTDKAAHSRFILTRKAPQIATGVEHTSDGEGAKARKLLIEDKMYILLNGMLYDATGKVVK